MIAAGASTGEGGRAGGAGDGEDEEGELTREEAEAHLCHMQDVLDRCYPTQARLYSSPTPPPANTHVATRTYAAVWKRGLRPRRWMQKGF